MSFRQNYSNYGAIENENESVGNDLNRVEAIEIDDHKNGEKRQQQSGSEESGAESGQQGQQTTMDDEDLISSNRTSRRICGSAASSSDSETADDAPLLPGEDGSSSSSRAVRIEIPGEKPASPNDRFPKQPEKALLTMLALIFSAVLNTITLSYVHEKYPRTSPLPDVVFDYLPYYQEGLKICEYLMIASFVSTLILIFFHKHRFIVFRRLCAIGSLLYLLRCLTLVVTQVPVADVNWKCAPKFGENATFWKIFIRGVKAVAGVGLNVAGDQTLCGDYIYSGHTLVLVLCALFMTEYSPRRWRILHWFSWTIGIVGVAFLLISHGHYTLDVIISYYITTRVFWEYHTMAAHPTLKLSVNNHYRKVLWSPIFYWLEKDIQRPVPRRFNVPFPMVNIRRWWQSRNLRRASTRHAIE